MQSERPGSLLKPAATAVLVLIAMLTGVAGANGPVSLTAVLRDHRVKADGCLFDFNSQALGSVYAIAVQADGKILVGGTFSHLLGQPRSRIGRLNPDGSLDTSFDPNANSDIRAIAVQPDGKIIVGGFFYMLSDQPRQSIGRLNADSSLDTSFDPGSDGAVLAIAIEPDGKVLVAGEFRTFGGQPRSDIARLNADGSLDPSFGQGAEVFNLLAHAEVYALALQQDGKILVGGKVFGAHVTENLFRFNADGSLDARFHPGANDSVMAIAVQPDRKIVVGGGFKMLGGEPRTNIGRLNPDGSFDDSFATEWDKFIYSITLQADGKILVGGLFNSLGNNIRGNFARLNADGSLDGLFTPCLSNLILTVVLQADGKILVGGDFDRPSAERSDSCRRLFNTTPASQSLKLRGGGSKIIWSRSGTSPEVATVTFELSTDGVNYALLGSGKRTLSGWKLSGLNLPKDQHLIIRARGYYAGSVVESVANLSPKAVASTTDITHRPSH